MKKQVQKLSQAMEDYVETIYVLSKDKGYARTGEIARSLNVSPSSVVEMVGKIAKLGFVEWRRYEGIFLSPEGRLQGEAIHIRHETLRQFFEFIGVSPDIANKEACIIEHELSPVTTSAIGNRIHFLGTPAGCQTISARKLFLKMQNPGISWDNAATVQEPVLKEMVMHSARKSQANHEILSLITRHDLLNTITALYRYLDLLRTMTTSEEMKLVVSRIEGTVQAMNRQVSTSSDHLIPGLAGQKWMNLGQLITHAESLVLLGSAVVEQNLDLIEIFGDTLIEKVVYNLIDNAIRHGDGVTRITCGYMQKENSLVWFIQDDGIGIPDEYKDQLFRTSAQNNRGTGLYLAYQVLSACGMQITECGTYGEGARFEIMIPNGLYRFVNMPIPKPEPVLPDISQPISHPCSFQVQ
ncbi:ATP-binding protein [Methanospirillum hungatei]|uniref:ATP-binding protein n=1 Tax=Methanospirillum hungatei TaxID=2203 RepID=UPI00005DDC9E|nr:ATP-binding protein [Methanospirillum hungatei]